MHYFIVIQNQMNRLVTFATNVVTVGIVQIDLFYLYQQSSVDMVCEVMKCPFAIEKLDMGGKHRCIFREDFV